jgi:hypothetical protein
MASQPPVAEERDQSKTAPSAVETRQAKPPRPPIGQVLRELHWLLLLAIGVGTGFFWVSFLLQGGAIQILAGLLPVTGGIFLGRRIKQHVNWHAALLGVITALTAIITTLVMIQIYGPNPLLAQALLFAIVTLLPFPAFGVITASRSEQRQRQIREEQARRGGRLDKPGRVRSIEDLHALSLPQLGGYVADLFRKHGFLVGDYRMEKDRDRIDFQMTYEDTPWLVRVTTVDKVKPGVVQELAQRMKVENVSKGVVISSMAFQETATRWAKDKPVALIDGETLLTMNDK